MPFSKKGKTGYSAVISLLLVRKSMKLWQSILLEFYKSIKIPLCKTSNGQRSFSYRGVTVWNQLSLEIKTAPTLAAFKTKLKSFLKVQRSFTTNQR